ncbi:glycosyltransferase [Halorussus marinus]|uniref:glycosyltransferase n=1 Tax=Halorussus marinus TaxID=2505976 RepID=UPI00106EC7CB|nr:glycosyltransferase [Halorussus marinus]
MARLAVVHNTLDLRSGADAVCLHVCEALQEVHDVTLFTLSHPPLAGLNRLFDTDAAVPVRTPPGDRLLGRAFATAADRAGPLLAVRSVLLDRFFRRHADGYDAAVSTANEFAPPIPSVQYVHYPQFNGRAVGDEDAPRLDALWSRLAGVGGGRLPGDATLVANSSWTADVVAERYDRRPAVVHPPVDPITGGADWADRENGVVVAGRIAPDKRTLDAIRIVDAVRERGPDLHLHVVGSAAPAYRSYVERVERAAAARSHVTVETDVPRGRLETLLTTHRYGLNAKPDEHFGMTVAEYVAAGMVAFAPDSGGQRDVLAGEDRRLYESAPDAAAKLSAAVESDARPSLARDRFASERFHRRLRDLVAETLPS